MDKVLEYRKAIAGLVTPALFTLSSALLPASDGGTAVTMQEWITIVLAALGTGTVVALTSNKTTVDKTVDPTPVPSDDYVGKHRA